LTAFVIIMFLIALNIIGIKESSDFNVVLVLVTIATELAVLLLGFLFAFDMNRFLEQLGFFGNPERIKYVSYTGLLDVRTENFLYGVTLAMSSYIGIESIAQAAEETRNPMFSVLGLGVLGWEVLAEEAYNPIASIASQVPVIGGIFSLGVAFVAFAINMVSTNTGVIGVSRVVYSMSRFKMLPRVFSRLHPTRATPYISIIVFSLVGGALALTGEIHFVASLYNFGALLSYFLVNLSHIRLRKLDREAYRNWKTPLNIKVNGVEYSLVAVAGLVSTGILFSLVVLYHPDGRVLGFTWVLVGVALYTLYRRVKGWGVFERRSVEEIPPATPHLRTAVIVTPGVEPEKVLAAIETQLPRIHRIFLIGHLDIPSDGRGKVAIDLAREFDKELEELERLLREEGYLVEHRIYVGGEEGLMRMLSDLSIDQAAFIAPKRLLSPISWTMSVKS